MPNWCHNRIDVVGDVSSFAKEVSKKNAFSFSSLHPIPKELEDEGWYEWCLANWGTKWDPEVEGVDLRSDGMTIVCYTSWTPPMYFLEKASADFPELQFSISFFEPGMCFAGRALIEGGRVVYSHECSEDEVNDILRANGYLDD